MQSVHLHVVMKIINLIYIIDTCRFIVYISYTFTRTARNALHMNRRSQRPNNHIAIRFPWGYFSFLSLALISPMRFWKEFEQGLLEWKGCFLKGERA